MEAFAAVPLVIGVIHGGKFIHRQFNKNSSKHRVYKWEERIAHAVSLIDAHKDQIQPAELEDFIEQHERLEYYKQQYLATEMHRSSWFEARKLGNNFAEKARRLVALAHSTSTQAIMNEAACKARHGNKQRSSDGKCLECYPESQEIYDLDGKKLSSDSQDSSDTLAKFQISTHRPPGLGAPNSEPNPWQSLASLRRNLDAAVRLS